jgi:hypothetical protein
MNKPTEPVANIAPPSDESVVLARKPNVTLVHWRTAPNSIEVFDFAKEWNRVKPHLNHPKVKGTFEYYMRLFLKGIRDDLEKAGRDTSHPVLHFDPNQGPWTQSTTSYWQDTIEAQAQAAVDRGEFVPDWKPDEKPTDEQWARFMEFEKRFHPQSGTYRWYQVIGACHWLAPWLAELGRRIFPQLHWRLMEGEAHSFAYGADDAGTIKIIFDILNFEFKSAMELIEFATRKETCKQSDGEISPRQFLWTSAVDNMPTGERVLLE